MRLVPCPCPSGPLDPAPLTALCGASDAAPAVSGAIAYEAFWAADDGYYLRRTVGGVASWLAGHADEEGAADGVAHHARRTGSHAMVAAPAGAAVALGTSRLRVVLVGRRHGRRRTRVPMHLCVRRVRPSS